MICQVYCATCPKSHSQPSGTATALLINGFLLEKGSIPVGNGAFDYVSLFYLT